MGVLATIGLGLSLALVPPASAGPSGSQGDPAGELAQRYAPVVRLVNQTEPCGHGEAYQPADVDAVLGNDEVALRGPWDTTTVVTVAPTAQDLSKGLFGYHLDFPGNALRPGCTFDEWSHRVSAGSSPTTYAHIVSEVGHPGQLALQYWFFYVYNDFNDKHEGDWEMIQLNFAATNATEALAMNPTEVGYSQHEGAERARWGDSKLQLVDGTHLVVYPALGSHANYYSSKLYLGRSAAQGVGCDDTIGPSRELRPEVSVIPTDPSAYLQRFPWLGYEGRWGEAHDGFYNGPNGPSSKDRWTAPITWTNDTWRDNSFTVPAGGSVGIAATDFFCQSVAAGSDVLTALVGDPSLVLLVLGALLLLLLWLASRTQWNVSAPFRVRRRRPWGSLVTSAVRMYGRHPRLFLRIGLLFVPVGLISTLAQFVIFRVGGLEPLVDSAGESNGVVATLAFALGLFFTLLGLFVVQAATAVAVAALDEGREVGALAAYRIAFARLRPWVGTLIGLAILVALLGVSGIGLLVAVWLTIRWSLFPQVVVLEEPARSPGPFRRSGRLVSGRWWRTASVTFFVTGLGLLLGPLLGTLLLFATSASFDFVNLVSSLVYVGVLPFVAITTTYLYYDLVVRKHEAEREALTSDVLPAEI